MTRHLFTLYYFTLSIICCFAQEMNVTSFDEAVYDLSAATASRLDLNGKACALVKVQAPVEGLLFEGNIIGNVDFKGGEYWVYLTEKSTELTIKHNNYYPCNVKLTDFGIHSVQSQRTYILKLKLLQESNVVIGIYDKDKCFSKCPMVIEANQKLQKLSAKYESEFNSLSAQFNKLYNDFITISEDPKISQKDKDLKIKEISDMHKKIEIFSNAATEDLKKRQQELFMPIETMFKEVLNDISDKYNLTYILDKENIRYKNTDKYKDLTDEICEIMLKYKY